MTRLLLVLVAALVAAPAARADGIAPFAVQGGPGVLAPDGRSRYVALGAGASTTIVRIDTETGGVLASTSVRGGYGIPVTTYTTKGEGISLDGKTLVVGDVVRSWPHTDSSFVLVDPRNLRVRDRIDLRGDFSFDALSPNGRRLYLIQHVDANNTARYVVRVVDTATLRLLPGRIADRTQRDWVMVGYALMRVTSSDGRWVYTLYDNASNVPFVHALDTVRGVAHCIGIPRTGGRRTVGGDPTRWTMRLDGATLKVGGWHVDTTTWKLSRATGGLPWWWIVAGAGLLLGAVTIVAAHGRRTGALTAGTARRDRSPARLGSWLPLTRSR
jgi:hypothetical protein